MENSNAQNTFRKACKFSFNCWFIYVKIQIHITIRNLTVTTLYFIIEPDIKH